MNTPESWTLRAQSLEEPSDVVMWSKRGAVDRYRAVARTLANEMQVHCTLLDYGCGLGGFSIWTPRTVKYLGYDWSEGMVKRATAEHPRYDFTAEPDLIQGPFDLIVAIGPFNLADNWSVKATFEKLDELWHQTRVALSVSLYHGDHPDCLSYSPPHLAAFARNRADRWRLDAHRSNDLLLTMWRTSEAS